jgi:hypothetical protein
MRGGGLFLLSWPRSPWLADVVLKPGHYRPLTITSRQRSRVAAGDVWPQTVSPRGCVWVGLPRAAVQVKTTSSTLGNLASMEGRSSTQATALFFLLPRCTAAATKLVVRTGASITSSVLQIGPRVVCKSMAGRASPLVLGSSRPEIRIRAWVSSLAVAAAVEGACRGARTRCGWNGSYTIHPLASSPVPASSIPSATLCLQVRGCLGVKFFHSFGWILQYSQILQYYIQNGVWQAS